jgi:hypothetical protein
MTPARKLIFIRLIKAIVANIRYEKHCLKQHDWEDSQDYFSEYDYRSPCSRGEHERDLDFFRKLLAHTLEQFTTRNNNMGVVICAS